MNQKFVALKIIDKRVEQGISINPNITRVQIGLVNLWTIGQNSTYNMIKAVTVSSLKVAGTLGVVGIPLTGAVLGFNVNEIVGVMGTGFGFAIGQVVHDITGELSFNFRDFDLLGGRVFPSLNVEYSDLKEF